MKPVDQTIFSSPGGNCFAACIASLLECEIEHVPNFQDAATWFQEWQNWLEPYNLRLLTASLGDIDQPQHAFAGYTIVGADSPHGPWLHAVVCRDGTIEHDPCAPSRHEGVGPWRDITWLVPLDIARPVGFLRAGERIMFTTDGRWPVPHPGIAYDQ